jgi:L-histidine N-alpha-methyltransferase
MPEAALPAAPFAEAAMLAEVRAGLLAAPKVLSPKFFYDTRGSELFEQITELPEYYLTRAERALLERFAPAWVSRLAPRSLVELGAGSARKTRILLDAMRATGCAERYLPVDVSGEFLEESARRLGAEYPELRVVPVQADLSAEFSLPSPLPHPVLHAFLGSTLGNFEPDAAVRLLRALRRSMAPADRLLLGLDLRKDIGEIERAYNDEAGVTAEFNRNLLHVLNHELGADFRPERFRHHAFYNSEEHRIEMHLISEQEQRVRIPGIGVVAFRAGESLRTELSHKYERAQVEELLASAGLGVECWVTERGRYALLLAAPREGAA